MVSISGRNFVNKMWSVETTDYNDWMELTYRETDSSNWNVPHVLGTNAGQPNGWPYREGYDDNANWLWASTGHFNNTMHFRRNLGEYLSF